MSTEAQLANVDGDGDSNDDRRTLASRRFPNVSPRAYYSPRSLAVFLPGENLPHGQTEDAQKRWFTDNLPVLTHEFQHALDHGGTVEGRILLDALARALFALERKLDLDPAELHRFVELHDAERRFDRRHYFTEYDTGYRKLGEGRPRWKWSTSTGVNFDHLGRPNEDDPLFFVRFEDVEQNSPVARQPITSAALFETRAVFAELEQSLAIHIVAAREDPDALDRLHREQQRLFYEPSLLLYSAPAHFAASHCTDGDSLDAYRVAAYAAGIVLNLAPELDVEPRIHERYHDSASLHRLERLRDLRDPGFLFIQLVAHAPRYDGDVDAWLDAALDAAGYPSRQTVLDAAYKHLSIPSFVTGGAFDNSYFQAATTGAVNFARLRGSLGLLDSEAMRAIGTPKGPIALPATILNNGIMPSPIEALIDPIDQLRLLEAETVLHHHIDMFLKACR